MEPGVFGLALVAVALLASFGLFSGAAALGSTVARVLAVAEGAVLAAAAFLGLLAALVYRPAGATTFATRTWCRM
jgi:hypothetical protein